MKNKEFPLSLIAQSMTPHAVKNHLLADEEKSSRDNRASGRFTNSREVSCARGTRILSVFLNTSIHMCAITIMKLLLCKLTGTLIVHPVTQCLFKAGQPSTTLAQHWFKIASTICVCLELYLFLGNPRKYRTRILVQVTIYRRLGRDGHLDQSGTYDIS